MQYAAFSKKEKTNDKKSEPLTKIGLLLHSVFSHGFWKIAGVLMLGDILYAILP